MVLITEIEDRRISKPFLGGYINSVTSAEYFNAASQTGPSRKCREWQEKARTRDVQCVELKESACQSDCNRATQTLRYVQFFASIILPLLCVFQHFNCSSLNLAKQCQLDQSGSFFVIVTRCRISLICTQERPLHAKHHGHLQDGEALRNLRADGKSTKFERECSEDSTILPGVSIVEVHKGER